MPYGQEIGGFNPQLAEAIAQQERLRQQQAQAQQMMRPSGGAGGKTDIITALLGGFMSGRAGNKIQEGEADIRSQIAEFQQQQAQAQEIKANEKQAAKVKSLIDSGLDPQKANLVAQGIAPYSAFQTKPENTLGNNRLKLDQDKFNYLKQQDIKAEQAPKPVDYKLGDNLRKEFQQLQPVKQFDEVNASMQKVINSTGDNTGASDIALITAFMKMNDPGSTVREGEFKTAADAGSANQKFWGMYQKVKSGEFLTPALRSQFVNSAHNLYASHADQYGRLREQYGKLAERQGMNPDNIFIKRSRIERPEQKTQAPSIGGSLTGNESLEQLLEMEKQLLKGSQ